MAQKIHHFKKYSIVDGNIRVQLDMSRFEGQFNQAQYELDSMVMTSMVPFMPHGSGVFVNRTLIESRSMAGTGRVCAAAGPFGRFLYKGKTMVDSATGSPWARPAAKKVLVSQYGGKTNAKEDLTFSNRKAQPEWFEAAKKVDGRKWIRKVKRIAGGGANGK